ncbi:MAG TPA: hypothetical protein PKL06_11750 [Chitinophagales bacterium]|nr:hypothetical protein [Chitinophagales bacterium]
MEVYDKYEAVIGLEVHAQLLTATKAYSSDISAYGGEPNTYVSPVTLGHPAPYLFLMRKAWNWR